MRVAVKFALVMAWAPLIVSGQALSTGVRVERAVPASRANEGGRAGTPADSIPLSVLAAEVLGARMPNPMAGFSFPTAVPGSTIAGSSARKCVSVGEVNPVRSGDFLAAGIPYYNSVWSTGFGKIGWQTPNTTPGTTPTLTVRATRLDSSAVTRVFEFPATEVRNNSSMVFYASGVHVPTTGRWMLVATAGSNWGCFLLTVD